MVERSSGTKQVTPFTAFTYWWTLELEGHRLLLKRINPQIARHGIRATEAMKSERKEIRNKFRNMIAYAWRNYIDQKRAYGRSYKTVISDLTAQKTIPVNIRKPDGTMTKMKLRQI